MVTKSEHPGMEDVSIISVLNALSDPIRLGIVRLLADGEDAGVVERQWGEFDAPVAKSTLSHHLKILRDGGITQTRQSGTRCYVRLRRAELDQRFPSLLDDILAGSSRESLPVNLKQGHSYVADGGRGR